MATTRQEKEEQLAALVDDLTNAGHFERYDLQGNFVNSTPITFPPAGPPEGNSYSYERCPSANDTNVGTYEEFTGYGGWSAEPEPDERYVHGYGRGRR